MYTGQLCHPFLFHSQEYISMGENLISGGVVV